jgi:hypothetical protein
MKNCKVRQYVVIVLLIAGSVATAQDKLVYKTDPGSLYEYVFTSDYYSARDRGGEIMESTTERKGSYKLVSESSDTVLTFISTIGKMTIKSEGGRGSRSQDLSGYEGKRIKIVVTPSGVEREPSEIDSLPRPQFRGRGGGNRQGNRGGGGNRPRPRFNPAGQFAVGFFALPAKTVSVGDKWTEKYKGQAPPSRGGMGRSMRFGGGTAEEAGEKKYEVLGKEKKMGLNCYHLKVTNPYTSESYREFGENTMSSEGEGERVWEVWFAPKEGVLVELSYEDFNETTMAMSGQRSGTYPSVSETKRILKLKKYKPAK